MESVHNGLYGDIPIRLTCKAADSTLMKAKFVDLGFAIDAGALVSVAWERVGYVLTTDGALEIPTNIAYPRSMIEQNLSPTATCLPMNLDTIGGRLSRPPSTTTCG